jgi:hypothetical protein
VFVIDDGVDDPRLYRQVLNEAFGERVNLAEEARKPATRAVLGRSSKSSRVAPYWITRCRGETGSRC